jgi:hypothetical protein
VPNNITLVAIFDLKASRCTAEVTVAPQLNQGKRKKCEAFIETIKKLLSPR